MTIYSTCLLCLSIALSTGRNIFSKSISSMPVKTKGFYTFQSVIFLTGVIPMLLAGGLRFSISMTTIVLAAIYGVLLVSAQWNYTIALKEGNVGICATVYSLGFILPTLSGMFFWNEKVSLVRIFGILMVIPAIIISGKKDEMESKGNGYFVPLILAMVSSGGLGIMQKVQQTTGYAEEKNAFILFAFLTAGLISLFASVFAKIGDVGITGKPICYCVLVGLCFSICNLLNTVLAGILDSAVFFPLLNIGSILFSLVVSVLAFNEKITKKTLVIMLLGALAIVFINVG